MKIILASADAEDVAWSATHGMLDGVLTTPALLADEDTDDVRAHLLELCRLVHGPIFASVHSLDAAGTYRDGRELAKLSDQIVVGVPLVEDTLGAIRRLEADGVRVAATHVFNVAQGLLAVRAGASSVLAAVDQLDAAGHNGVGVVGDLRRAFDASNAECDVIAVNPASPTQFGACAIAGADAAALSADLCRAMLVHPLTDRALERFVGDVARVGKAWSGS